MKKIMAEQSIRDTDKQYRWKNAMSLIFHSFRLLVSGFIVIPGVMIIGSLLIASLNMDGGLASVLKFLITDIAETSVVIKSQADYQSVADNLYQVWFIFGIIGFGISLALSPWRSPSSVKHDHAMDQWHISNMDKNNHS